MRGLSRGGRALDEGAKDLDAMPDASSPTLLPALLASVADGVYISIVEA